MSESSRMLWVDCQMALGDVSGATKSFQLPPEAWLPTGQANHFLLSIEATLTGYSAAALTAVIKAQTPTADFPRTTAFEDVGDPCNLDSGQNWVEIDIGRGGVDAAVRGMLRLVVTNTSSASLEACVRMRVWVAAQSLPVGALPRAWGR